MATDKIKNPLTVEEEFVTVSLSGLSVINAVIKKNGIVSLVLSIGGELFSNAAHDDILCQLPVGFYPKETMYFLVCTRDNGAWGAANYTPCTIQITSGGTVKLACNNTAIKQQRYLWGACTWVAAE